MTNQPLYNFRLRPEAIWLIVNTVLGAVLVDLAGRALEATNMIEAGTFPTVDTLGAWGVAIGVAAVRTLIGAILAAATGQFLGPGETPDKPAPG